MADHRPSLVEPAEHRPAGTADRFSSRNARQRLELLVPRVDTEGGPKRHQRVARVKGRGHLPGTLAAGTAAVKRAFTGPLAQRQTPLPTCAPRTPFLVPSVRDHTAGGGGRFPAVAGSTLWSGAYAWVWEAAASRGR